MDGFCNNQKEKDKQQYISATNKDSVIRICRTHHVHFHWKDNLFAYLGDCLFCIWYTVRIDI